MNSKELGFKRVTAVRELRRYRNSQECDTNQLSKVSLLWATSSE